MKLKKIASLMLAGIMAVSMLAACGDSTTDNTGDNSSSSRPQNHARNLPVQIPALQS